jgi:hypothetical protein
MLAEYERHSHHTAFHCTTEPGLHQQTAQPDSFVPFQQRHAHQTYTVPQSAIRLHLAGLTASATRHWTRAAPGYRPVHASCWRRISPSSLERRFAKRIRPRIARRGKAVMCAQKRTFKPVSNADERSQAAVGSTAQGMPPPPAVPRSPWTPFPPGIPPRNSNSQGAGGTLGGSWCCWPTLQQLHLVLVKDTGRHDKGDCVQ